ncbi:hypothetical protein ACFQX6_05365 [Streptosporangium lutulentum]
MRTLRIGTFSPSVVLGVAAATGALDAAGLAITQVPARSSPSSSPRCSQASSTRPSPARTTS